MTMPHLLILPKFYNSIHSLKECVLIVKSEKYLIYENEIID